jgi:hypothetical protein
MYYIGLDVHKKPSYCVKDVSGRIQQGGKVGSTRRELDCWMKTLPQPWSVGMEATIFSGWICDHLLPHAAQIKVAHPLMLRAIAAETRHAAAPLLAASGLASRPDRHRACGARESAPPHHAILLESQNHTVS